VQDLAIMAMVSRPHASHHLRGHLDIVQNTVATTGL
jgi:hypothetical protein